MPKINNNGVKIYYEMQGEGEPFCLIMGWGGASNFWYNQPKILSKHYKLILIDNRGVGRSSKPDFPYTMQMFVEDIKAVLDNLKIRKLHLMGCSMGGMIVQNFVLKYPEMLKSLILVCTSSNMKLRYSGSIQLERLFSTTNLTPEALMTIMSLFLSRKYIDWLLSDEGKEERNKLMVNLGSYIPSMKSMTYQWEAIKGHNTFDSLKEIKIPTLIIAGKQDILLPPKHSKVLYKNIINSELSILETGHAIWIEREKEFSKIVLDFLNKQNSNNKLNRT